MDYTDKLINLINEWPQKQAESGGYFSPRARKTYNKTVTAIGIHRQLQRIADALEATDGKS